MDHYDLIANNFSLVFGSPDKPITDHNVTIIGRKSDDSTFLVLAPAARAELDAPAPLDEYVFTYNQGWGTATTSSVVQQANDEVTAKYNADIEDQIYVLERESMRPLRELRRNADHSDVPAADVAFAQNKIRKVDTDIKALRALLS